MRVTSNLWTKRKRCSSSLTVYSLTVLLSKVGVKDVIPFDVPMSRLVVSSYSVIHVFIYLFF